MKKKKMKKLVLAKETLRSIDLAVGRGLTDGTCTNTCGNTCGTCTGGSRYIACFNTQQTSCTC